MQTARVLAVFGVAFYLVKVAATTISLTIASNDQAAKLEALDHVPLGGRLVTLSGQECGNLWNLPRNSHLGAMAIVRRHAFSNDQWAIEGANLLSVHYRQAGRFIADPSEIVKPRRCANREHWTPDRSLAAIPRDAFDYVWLVDVPPYDPGQVADMQLIWRGPGSLLYAIGRTGDQSEP